MRVVVTGSRDWTDVEAIRKELAALPPGSRVAHGACRGADAIADRVATELGFEVKRYPADWKRLGKPAGRIRNGKMLRAEKPELVLAFPLRGSRGTIVCMQIAEQLGLTVKNCGQPVLGINQ